MLAPPPQKKSLNNIHLISSLEQAFKEMLLLIFLLSEKFQEV